MPTKAPQDHKAKDEGFSFTVGAKTYKLPPLSETAADSIPGDITYAAIMEPDNDSAQLRLAFASLEAAKPTEAAMKALKSLPTTRMFEVVGDWMGKVGGLLGVLKDHRGAVEYDFRSQFGVGINIIGRGMSLAEAARHVERFRSDPSTALAAEVEGWDHPVSRIEAVLMDLWDLTAAMSGAKRPPRYERPWKSASVAERHGNAAGRSPEEVKRILRERFHQSEAPI